MPRFARLLLLLPALALAPTLGRAQSSCSSDGLRAPVVLAERFLSAECAECWATPSAALASRSTVLDWIVPSPLGDDAPLSAAALPEATGRLNALHAHLPATASEHRKPVIARPYRLRVAHGMAVGGYAGAAIEMPVSPVRLPPGPLQAWLALVEHIPAGLEGTPSPRNLVRSTFSRTWTAHDIALARTEGLLRETRAMGLGASANPQRLRVIGWVEDARGQVLAAAQSHCTAE
jgi:hypothetical protein